MVCPGADRKRVICVGLVAVAFFQKLVARNRSHRLEQPRVANAAGLDLGLDHLLTLRRESFGMEFGNQAVSISSAGEPGRRS